METCPFCGAEYDRTGPIYKWYKCKTNEPIFDSVNYGPISRSEDCYKNQLAQQAELLGKALEVVREFVLKMTPKMCLHAECPICYSSYTWLPFHDKYCTVTKARALIPDLKKALEKKP